MTSKRFNPEKDFAPMLFNIDICHLALAIKKNGLVWRPMSGVLYGTRINSSNPPPIFPAEFISSYLNILRQSERTPADWIPETLSIDAELTDGMRHFYSDYQHITKEFYRLDQKLARLQQADKVRQFNLYQNMIDDILQGNHRQSKAGDRDESTG